MQRRCGEIEASSSAPKAPPEEPGSTTPEPEPEPGPATQGPGPEPQNAGPPPEDPIEARCEQVERAVRILTQDPIANQLDPALLPTFEEAMEGAWRFWRLAAKAGSRPAVSLADSAIRGATAMWGIAAVDLRSKVDRNDPRVLEVRRRVLDGFEPFAAMTEYCDPTMGQDIIDSYNRWGEFLAMLATADDDHRKAECAALLRANSNLTRVTVEELREQLRADRDGRIKAVRRRGLYLPFCIAAQWVFIHLSPKLTEQLRTAS